MTSDSASQLPLGIRLNDEATFTNFLVSSCNRPLFDVLTSTSPSVQLIYLWGAEGSGRSHLLQALCHRYAESGASALYLPLLSRHDFAPQILEHSHALSVICVDDLGTPIPRYNSDPAPGKITSGTRPKSEVKVDMKIGLIRFRVASITASFADKPSSRI